MIAHPIKSNPYRPDFHFIGYIYIYRHIYITSISQWLCWASCLQNLPSPQKEKKAALLLVSVMRSLLLVANSTGSVHYQTWMVLQIEFNSFILLCKITASKSMSNLLRLYEPMRL
ncbi:hypothetical protein CIPAW_03G020400 [Carya illinoinensis]|uniref:Uncharacterized protein n=1 Tax=Carya illinoinensis TaxID=32201 RepID=A0A8T1QZA4_CARIL|nr:hypothetical protein CIPAW_03G020400 [Carya illinoinensis]